MNLKSYKKFLLIGLCVTLAALLLLGGAVLALLRIDKGLLDTNAAERFARGDLPYTQISLYFSRDAAVSSAQMDHVAAELEQNLTNDSYAAPSDSARVLLYAYGAQASAYFEGEKGSATARVLCTGGDFFYFHPQTMTSGWYYGDRELNETIVVLNEHLAWQLFGALDVAGMMLTVDGVSCTVVGVTSGPDGRSEQKEYGDEPTAYIPYALAERLNGSVPIEYVDTLLPDPVTDYGKKLVRQAFGFPDDADSADNGKKYLIENTARYSPFRVIASLKDKNTRITRTDTVVYPYWENAARLADARASVWGVFLIVTAIFPTVYLLIWLVLLFNRKEILLKKGFNGIAKGFKKVKTTIKTRKKEKKA